MNSYFLAVSGITYALCVCNQSEFDVMMMVVMVMKIFSLLRGSLIATLKQRILDAKITRFLII